MKVTILHSRVVHNTTKGGACPHRLQDGANGMESGDTTNLPLSRRPFPSFLLSSSREIPVLTGWTFSKREVPFPPIPYVENPWAGGQMVWRIKLVSQSDIKGWLPTISQHFYRSKNRPYHFTGDFYGLVVKNCLPVQGTLVRSLAGSWDPTCRRAAKSPCTSVKEGFVQQHSSQTAARPDAAK